MSNIHINHANGSTVIGGNVTQSSIRTGQLPDVFEQIRAALAQVSPTERERLLPALDELQQARDNAEIASKYGAFMQLAANHMSVIQPFLPALTDLFR